MQLRRLDGDEVAYISGFDAAQRGVRAKASRSYLEPFEQSPSAIDRDGPESNTGEPNAAETARPARASSFLDENVHEYANALDSGLNRIVEY